jgi:epoxyqueuosine reductase QueG
MNYDLIRQAPEPVCAAEVIDQYGRGSQTCMAVANWIRSQGHDAVPHGGPMAGSINIIPAAISCGIGELGKNGSIISRKHGPNFRLAYVLTNIPLETDTPDEFGADDYCTRCKACSKVCPTGAIYDEKQLVRGIEKWYINFDKCIPFFNETAGCAICLGICPWSIPGNADNLINKMLRRKEDS